MSASRPVLVTGATGFVGSALVPALVARGAGTVVALARDPAAVGVAGAERERWRLGEELPRELDGVCAGAVLVHLAWPTRGDAREAAAAAAASCALFAAARARGVARVVFVSSLAAVRGAGAYGREKARVERALDPERDLALRPGLVLGDGGIAGRLRTSLRRLPIAPDFGPQRALPVVSLAVLVSVLAAAVDAAWCGVLPVAEPVVPSWRRLVEDLAAAEGRRVRWVPVAPQLGRGAVRLLAALSALGVRPPFGADALASLLDPPPAPSAAELAPVAALLAGGGPPTA